MEKPYKNTPKQKHPSKNVYTENNIKFFFLSNICSNFNANKEETKLAKNPTKTGRALTVPRTKPSLRLKTKLPRIAGTAKRKAKAKAVF